jgi:DNA-binding response OmpR family regulator
MRIGILEDDPEQCALVHEALSSVGHVCHNFTTGRAIVDALQRQTFDLLALDWEVPEMSGEQVLQWTRQNLAGHIPVLFMTVRCREGDVVAILNAGADDFVTKPLCAGVLRARVNALLRRAYGFDASVSRTIFGEFEFDLSSRQILHNGIAVPVTQRAFSLALLLFENMGRTLSRAHIRDVVWQQMVDIPSRTMDTHVSWLRSKLGLRPENGYRLAPIYGYGYRLEQTRIQDTGASNDELSSPNLTQL